jgi:hypothetical protein
VKDLPVSGDFAMERYDEAVGRAVAVFNVMPMTTCSTQRFPPWYSDQTASKPGDVVAIFTSFPPPTIRFYLLENAMVTSAPSSGSHDAHTSNTTNGSTNGRLPEELVQDGFHSYLKSSLTQAKVERLVDEELLSSAEGDLMITGGP